MIYRDDFAQRLSLVRQRMERALLDAARAADAVTLLAVSKTRSTDEIADAWHCGVRQFGENYVQELVGKVDALRALSDVQWHAIGHIQTNKAPDVARCAHWVHGVDSERLARALGTRAQQALDRGERTEPLRVLVQVNVANEPQKSGCKPDETAAICDVIQTFSSLTLRGLMTIPPESEDPLLARPTFEGLAQLRDALGGSTRLPDLSMGMSHDLEVAIACGATIVRVGTALFGPRASRL